VGVFWGGDGVVLFSQLASRDFASVRVKVFY
jgi:hypothetical protein